MAPIEIKQGSYNLAFNYAFDVAYGTHERHRLDIWLARSTTTTPLVVFIHGGGFRTNDKAIRLGSPQLPRLVRFLHAGVSFAAINYRYLDPPTTDILTPLCDCKQALQFLRSQAGTLNIDPDRVGAYGGSAGGGASLWLAFTDQMGKPTASDPIARQSTRLSVVGGISTQATHDIAKWPKILGAGGVPVPANVRTMIVDHALQAYGADPGETLSSPEVKAVRDKVDYLAHMSSDDPPMWISNPGCACLADLDAIYHHPRHASALGNKGKGLLPDVYVYAPALGGQWNVPEKDQVSLVEFFLRHL